MALELPRYLTETEIQDDRILYTWDDWNKEQAEEHTDDELNARLAGIAPRALLALMCGSAEWIVHRFANLCDVTAPWQCLEAAWATMIDMRYSSTGVARWEEVGEKWSGPVKGPLSWGLIRLETATQQLHWEFEHPALFRAGALISLATHIMPKPEVYEQWCLRVVERLETLYPLEDDLFGDVVPRIAMDVDQPFDPTDTERLVNEFLSRLDPNSNPFLTSRESILDQKWEGPEEEEPPNFAKEPYHFNMATDREVRKALWQELE